MQSDDIVQNFSCDNSPDKEEINPIHGIVYQLKLSMLYLKIALDTKHDFELYFEKKDAEKFDDVVFKYKDKDDKDRKYRFLQAKHKSNPKKENITIKHLLPEKPKNSKKPKKEPFDLQKYIISFYRIEQKPQYKDKTKDYIICTNTDFSKDIYTENRLIKQEDKDDMLCIKNSERYKLKFSEINEDIINKLKNVSDLKNLAEELATAFCNKKLNFNNEVLKAYHVPLEEKVFDKIKISKNDQSEKDKWYYIFKQDFIENNNLSFDTKRLREAFEIAVKQMKSNINNNNNNLWNTLRNTKFDILKLEKHVTGSTGNNEITILPNDITENEIEMFFNKLVFAVKQPNEEELGKILIQEKIFESLDYLKNNDHAQLIYDHVQKEILDWLKNSKNKALINKDNFFEKAQEKIKGIMHHIPNLEYSCYIKELNIKFQDECKEIKELKTILNSEGKIFNLISFEKNISLTKAEVYKVKEQAAWDLQNILNLKMFGNNKAESLFTNDLLIIICKNESEIKHNNVKELCDEFFQIIKKDDNKRIILITENNSNLAEFFSKQSDLKNNYKEKLCRIRVRDLDKNYLREQLMKEKIIFQGQQRSLANLLNIEDKVNESNNCELSKEILKTLEKVLKSETLSEFIFKKNIVVGNKLHNFTNYDSPYYDPYYIDIPRTFSHQVIDENSLKECVNKRKEDLFAFPLTVKDHLNILVSEKKNNIRMLSEMTDNISDKEFFEGIFFILDGKDPETDFEKVCNQCNGKNIHWLTSINEKNNKFKVKYSNKLSNLQEFMKLENLGKEIECSSRVIIIGDPGVGKSTTLTTYFQKINKHLWRVRINLKDHQEYIKTANFDNIDKIVEFLCRSSPKGFKSALAKSLLNYYFECGDRVILLLDGYDEITSNNQEKVIKLLRSFPANNKIWLTTRSNQQYKIENALGNTFSYFLNPFNEEEQKKFLNKYWIKKLNIEKSDQKEQNNVDKFTKKLLEHFHQIGLMTSENLIGIVLQARMVADTCLKYYEEFNKYNSFKININNISDLYEKFIEYQYERYFAKSKIDKLSSYNDLRITLTKLYSEVHGYFAISALFPENQLCKKYLVNRKCREFSLDVLNDIGLMKNSEEKYFVHFTYAEYFVAKLLVNMLNTTKEHLEYKLAREFLLKYSFLNRFKLIRYFFEYAIKNICYNKEFDVVYEWEEIGKCELFSEIKRKPELKFGQFKKEISINPMYYIFDDANVKIQDNFSSNKTLDELIKDFESYMATYINENLRYDYKDTSFDPEKFSPDMEYLIDKIFRNFHKETNIIMLRNALKFLLKINSSFSFFTSHQIIRYCFASFDWYDFQDKLNLSIAYYLIQTELKNRRNIEFERNIFESRFKGIINCPKIKLNFMCFLEELNKYDTQRKKLKEEGNSIKKRTECMKKLINLLVPDDKNKYSLTELAKLNYKHYYIAKLEIIKDINSIKSLNQLCTKKIIDFLANAFEYTRCCPYNTVLTIFEKPHLTYLKSFFVDIILHRERGTYSKDYINMAYEKRNIEWLQLQGILFVRIFKILTPKISKIFNSKLDDILFIYNDKFRTKNNMDHIIILNICNTIQIDMINYIVDMMETENLLQIDKLAFLQMIVKFSTTEIKYCHIFYFNLNQVKTILKLIENMLKEKTECVFKILESVEFLYILKKVGLYLISTSDRILVLDEKRNLLYELLNNYNDQITELLQWKHENYELSKDEFIKKCYEIIETKNVI